MFLNIFFLIMSILSLCVTGDTLLNKGLKYGQFQHNLRLYPLSRTCNNSFYSVYRSSCYTGDYSGFPSSSYSDDYSGYCIGFHSSSYSGYCSGCQRSFYSVYCSGC